MSFDPVEICAVLSEEGVEFVVLGGFTALSRIAAGSVGLNPGVVTDLKQA